MVRGRKRHIVTDTLGLLLIVVVTAANLDDGATAPRLLAGLPAVTFPRLAVVWADRKYRNSRLDAWLSGQDRLRVEVSSKPEGERGFKPLKVRWVVEQTFGCLLRWRRLVRDFERLPETTRRWSSSARSIGWSAVPGRRDGGRNSATSGRPKRPLESFGTVSQS